MKRDQPCHDNNARDCYATKEEGCDACKNKEVIHLRSLTAACMLES